MNIEGLSVQEVNTILIGLSKFLYENVLQLIPKIQAQASKQMEPKVDKTIVDEANISEPK